MQLQSVTQLLNEHGIKLITSNGKLLTVKHSPGEIPHTIKRLLHKREHDLIAWLKQRDPVIHDIIPIKPAPRTQPSIASCLQNTLWQANNKTFPHYTYNKQITLQLKGFIEPDLLNYSLNELIKRHEILRTVFRKNGNGQLIQNILPPYSMLIPLIPLLEIYTNNNCDEQAINKVAQDQGHIKFDLTQGPLFRVALLQLPEFKSVNNGTVLYSQQESHWRFYDPVLLFSYHQTILDERSCQLLLEQLMSIYSNLVNNTSSVFLKPNIEYADYTNWEKQWSKNDAYKRCQRYWEGQLTHFHNPLPLPYDRPRTALNSHHGALEKGDISAKITKQLFALGRRENVSIYTLLLSTVQILLLYRTGETHIHVGTTLCNRPDKQLQQMIGPLADLTVVHSDLSNDITFKHLLHKTHLLVTEALCIQPIAYNNLVDLAHNHHWPKKIPLCQVTLDVDFANTTQLQNQSSIGSVVKRFLKTSPFEMSLVIEMISERFEITLTYQSDLFNRNTIKQFLHQYQYLLEVVTSNANQPISTLISTI